MSMFITVSRAGEELLPLARQFSEEWSIPLIRSRPLPQEGLGLILQREGPALYAPPAPPKQWHPGFAKNRWVSREHDTLIRALGGPNLWGLTVLDGTFGMGHDALLMARCGAHVIAYEHNPLMAYYALRGVASYDLDAATRLSVRLGDHATHPLEERVDVVYLDPMYPELPMKGWRHSPTYDALRGAEALKAGALRAETLSPERLGRALQVARRSVVIKLAPNEPPPPPPEGALLETLKSNRVRVAVYTRASLHQTPMERP